MTAPADMTIDELAKLVGKWALSHGYLANSASIVVQCMGGMWSARAYCGPMTSGASCAATGYSFAQAIGSVANQISVWLTNERPADVIELTLEMIQSRAKAKAMASAADAERAR